MKGSERHDERDDVTAIWKYEKLSGHRREEFEAVNHSIVDCDIVDVDGDLIMQLVVVGQRVHEETLHDHLKCLRSTYRAKGHDGPGVGAACSANGESLEGSSSELELVEATDCIDPGKPLGSSDSSNQVSEVRHREVDAPGDEIEAPVVAHNTTVGLAMVLDDESRRGPGSNKGLQDAEREVPFDVELDLLDFLW